MKRLLVCLCILFLLPAMALSSASLCGFVKGSGYQYAVLGQYPYESDGTPAPVLWRILDVRDGAALLLTEYVIDASQVIFESDPAVIEAQTYRRISAYEESDLHTFLNTQALDTLLGGDAMLGALIDEPGMGRLFILTDEQYLRAEYGFINTRWGVQKSRQAKATPYATKRGAYSDHTTRTCPYWAAAIKSADGTRMQLVGYDGHLSWGAYTRTNVGLRLAVRLDLSKCAVAGGTGEKDDPFTLAYTGAQTALPTPEPTPEPTATPAIERTAGPSSADGVTVSFVGDCSVGDSHKAKGSAASYHARVDQNGYAWPLEGVRDVLLADDLTCANLEVCFTSRRPETNKMFSLMADADHTAVLTQGGIDMVNTVNNHCADFGLAGYQDTLDALDAAGIGHFGCLYPLEEYGFDVLATRDVGGIRFGFIGFSYPQSYDIKRIAKRIETLRAGGCDIVAVSLHWGREESGTPTVDQPEYARQLIDAGADIIWGHHAHVLQPIQFYQGKPILYSTGNFTFGAMSSVDPATAIFQLTYEKTQDGAQLVRLAVVPCMFDDGDHMRPRIVTGDAERRDVFARLVWAKTPKGFENPPASFLDTGIIELTNGRLVP